MIMKNEVDPNPGLFNSLEVRGRTKPVAKLARDQAKNKAIFWS